MKLPDFGFDWINVSDQADLVDLTQVRKYVTFSIVLLIWEIIPTCVVVIIFRIKKTEVANTANNTDIIPRRVGRSVFLDNGSGAPIDDAIDESTNLLNNAASAINSIKYDTRLNQRQDSFTNSSVNTDYVGGSFVESFGANRYGSVQNESQIISVVNENYKFE